MAVYTIPKVTTAERTGYTPIEAEHIYDDDLNEVFVGDGLTAGGKSLIGPPGPPGSGLSALVDDLSPQLGGFLDPNGKYIGRGKGADISSASPLVALTDGDYADVTGTTGFSSITIAAGRNVRYRFTGILTLVVSANLVLNNGGNNYTTAVGDIIDFQSTSANSVVGTITKVDGSSVVGFTLATPQSTSSGTEKIFSNIPPGTTMIIISSTSVSLSSQGIISLILGDAGGFETSGYSATLARFLGQNDILFTSPTSSFSLLDLAQSHVTNLTGNAFLTLLDSTNNIWSFSTSSRDSSSNVSFGAGSKSLSGELTQLKISGGTFDNGSINISYQ